MRRQVAPQQWTAREPSRGSAGIHRRMVLNPCGLNESLTSVAHSGAAPKSALKGPRMSPTTYENASPLSDIGSDAPTASGARGPVVSGAKLE